MNGPSLHYRGDRHCITIAPSRTGKGTCSIIPNLLTLNRSVICVDPKGQNAAVTARRRADFGKVHLLNPFNEHGMGTARFNPLAALSITSPNLVADVGSLAEALIVTESAKDPYFDNTARDLVKLLIVHLIATHGSRATLPEVRGLLTLLAQPRSNNRPLAELVDALLQSPHAFVRQPAGRFFVESRDITSAVNTAITQTGFLDDPAIAHVLNGSDFSMQDFKERMTTLYIILPSRFVASYARFFRLVVVSAIDALTARTGGTPTTIMLDEFAQLGHLSAIENAFGLAAGYNVQLWPFVQDLNQLKDLYDKRWESFLGNAGVIQVFTPNDMTTAEYFSKRAGTYTREVHTRSQHEISRKQASGGFTGINVNESFVAVPLVSPQELLALPADRQLLFMAGTSKVFNARRLSYLENAALRALAEPDPFHSG